MARVHLFGQEFAADPVRKLDNGNWIMRARAHGPRFVPGTEIEVKPSEIVEMSAAETPGSDGLAALETAMAEERKTLPSVESILKPIQEAAKPVRAAEADAVAGEGHRATPFPQTG